MVSYCQADPMIYVKEMIFINQHHETLEQPQIVLLVVVMLSIHHTYTMHSTVVTQDVYPSLWFKGPAGVAGGITKSTLSHDHCVSRLNP